MEFVFAVEDHFSVRIPEEQLDPRQAGITLAHLADRSRTRSFVPARRNPRPPETGCSRSRASPRRSPIRSSRLPELNKPECRGVVRAVRLRRHDRPGRRHRFAARCASAGPAGTCSRSTGAKAGSARANAWPARSPCSTAAATSSTSTSPGMTIDPDFARFAAAVRDAGAALTRRQRRARPCHPLDAAPAWPRRACRSWPAGWSSVSARRWKLEFPFSADDCRSASGTCKCACARARRTRRPATPRADGRRRRVRLLRRRPRRSRLRQQAAARPLPRPRPAASAVANFGQALELLARLLDGAACAAAPLLSSSPSRQDPQLMTDAAAAGRRGQVLLLRRHRALHRSAEDLRALRGQLHVRRRGRAVSSTCRCGTRRSTSATRNPRLNDAAEAPARHAAAGGQPVPAPRQDRAGRDDRRRTRSRSSACKGRVHFNVGGAQAIEDSLKLVRNAKHGKSLMFAFEGGYHGRTLGASAITSSYRYRRRYGHFGERAQFVPFPYHFRGPKGMSKEEYGEHCVHAVRAPVRDRIQRRVGPEGRPGRVRRLLRRADPGHRRLRHSAEELLHRA